MIQEYYLHMFCGMNGEHDQSTGAGRLAIATLMAGFGLQASTKKDLQTRIEWRVTPGCFLGQREIADNDYYVRNYVESVFVMKLMKFRKVNRTMNYQLDWSALDDNAFDFKSTSTVWINLAKMYWLGFFLFGRNVLPDYVLAKIRERWTPEVDENPAHHQVLKSHFIMQFFKNIDLPIDRIRVPHAFTDREENFSRTEIFFSFTIAMNWSENATGFFATGAMINDLVPAGRTLGDIAPHFSEYITSRSGRFAGNYMPLTQQYYYTFGIGRPQLPSTPGRMPTYARDIIPLLFCDMTRTPQQEASSGYTQVRGNGFNSEYLEYNLQAWLTGALLWEYYLMLTGRELFPLEHLRVARVTKEWEPDYILSNLGWLSPTNLKNCSVSQLVRFNLERQLQV